MKLNSQTLTFELSAKELSVWMVALRHAAKTLKDDYPGDWKNNPFLLQHFNLVGQTGFCSGDHQDLCKAIMETRTQPDETKNQNQ